jgi:hypothetical protein
MTFPRRLILLGIPSFYFRRILGCKNSFSFCLSARPWETGAFSFCDGSIDYMPGYSNLIGDFL